MSESLLLKSFDLLATAPGGVARLRELILTLAVNGKLVQQNPQDESGNDLLLRISSKVVKATSKQTKVSECLEIGVSGSLPASWAWARLGQLVENMGSGWSPACDEGERNDPKKWAVLRTTSVQIMEFRPREHKVLPTKLTPRPDLEVKDGDILITRAGPMNRVGISCAVTGTPPRLMLSDKIVRFHSLANEMLPSFIVLCLNAGWTKTQLETAKTGMAASQVNISQSDLRNLWLPVCSREEQSRIVTRVEELMKLCDALELNGRLADEQHARLTSTLFDALASSESAHALAENWERVAENFDLLLDRPEAVDALEQTILQLAVTGLLSQNPLTAAEWRQTTLGQVATFLNGYAFKSEWFRNSGVPLVRNVNVAHGSIEWSQKVCVDNAIAKELSRFSLSEGDLLVSLDRPIISTGLKYAVVRRTDLPSLLLQRVAKLEPRQGEITIEYLELWLISPEFTSNIDPGRSNGVPHISTRQLESLSLFLPPIEEQRRIVSRVEELRTACAGIRTTTSKHRTMQIELAAELVESALS